VGLAAGWLAGKMLRGQGFGALGNIVVGVIGALLGRLIFGVVGLAPTHLVGQLIVATVGAVALILIVGALARK
jgi:uncharacterized membrane protein YeaQ/YmgE (transglycosylase-associated protein family)